MNLPDHVLLVYLSRWFSMAPSSFRNDKRIESKSVEFIFKNYHLRTTISNLQHRIFLSLRSDAIKRDILQMQFDSSTQIDEKYDDSHRTSIRLRIFYFRFSSRFEDSSGISHAKARVAWSSASRESANAWQCATLRGAGDVSLQQRERERGSKLRTI